MRSPRIVLVLAAAALALAACDRTPTGKLDAPSASARFDGSAPLPPTDTTKRGGGFQGSGG
jgi:hypothetical protein